MNPKIGRLEQRRKATTMALPPGFVPRPHYEYTKNRVHSTLHRPCSHFTNGSLVPTTRFHRRLLLTQGSGGAGEPHGALFYTFLHQDESVLSYKPKSINSPIFMLSLS